MCRPPQGALGFVAAPSIVNQDTITEHTIQKKSPMAKVGLYSSEHFAKEGVSTEIVMRLEVHKEAIQRLNIVLENIDHMILRRINTQRLKRVGDKTIEI
jgi:hypothetical protein